MAITSVVIGSEHGFADQTISVNDGGGATSAPMTFAYSGTYLDHTTTGLSMLKTLEAAITAAGTWTTAPEVFLSGDGYVRITAEPAFSITWTASGTEIRDALGFTGDLSSATSHTAPGFSPLVWIARRPESPKLGILEGDGALDPRDVTLESVDGTMYYRSFGTVLRKERWEWIHILPANYWTSDENDGELWQFCRDVLGPRNKFFFYSRNDIDESSTAEVALTNRSGPWVATDKNIAGLVKRVASQFGSRECRFDFTLNARTTPEYTT